MILERILAFWNQTASSNWTSSLAKKSGLQSESMFLSEAVKVELPQLGLTLMSLYASLANFSYERGWKLWKVSPKHHLFCHLCEDQAPVLGNPCYYWTYGDEDLVGRMVSVAESIHPANLPISVLTKWLHVVFDQLLLQDVDDD